MSESLSGLMCERGRRVFPHGERKRENVLTVGCFPPFHEEAPYNAVNRGFSLSFVLRCCLIFTVRTGCTQTE